MLALLVLKMALKHTGSKDTRNKSEIMTGRKDVSFEPFLRADYGATVNTLEEESRR